ncbi:MAG TPA: HAMP domain-containing sensor histidine kinase [Acidimicrobiales bacterium]|nr:HAMP domain-containing sensor histidine kinase [Acidimicrobiales bacterium]
MSLRSRLLLVVVGLATVGLLATDVLTYRALRSFLLDRVDRQLVAAQKPVAQHLVGPSRRTEPLSDAIIPDGTYAAILDVDGRVLKSVPFTYEGELPDPARPALDEIELARRSSFTVGSTEGGLRYRVRLSRLDNAGNQLLVAIPLTEVSQTLRRLVGIEAVATTLVLAFVGLAAYGLVRAGLRPLEDIGEVAGNIAAGDLSPRVPGADQRTEVGRLASSLNAMLGQIQTSFEARQQSEERLRRFVADASHELRTPLTSIRGYAELFRRGAAERPDDLAKAMRRIEEESSRMSVLVDDLLLLARLDQGRPLERAPVDLVRVAADAVDDARAASPGRSITLEAPERLDLEGDDLRLRQVAANLLSNALQHTPPDAAVEVRVRSEGDQAVLEVADHGPGLDADQAARVFERFYRGDPSRTRSGGGSGLGLSIVAAIAEAHGGRATVDSAPGRGTCVRVTLPVGAPATPASAPTPAPAPTEEELWARPTTAGASAPPGPEAR